MKTIDLAQAIYPLYKDWIQNDLFEDPDRIWIKVAKVIDANYEKPASPNLLII